MHSAVDRLDDNYKVQVDPTYSAVVRPSENHPIPANYTLINYVLLYSNTGVLKISNFECSQQFHFRVIGLGLVLFFTFNHNQKVHFYSINEKLLEIQKNKLRSSTE